MKRAFKNALMTAYLASRLPPARDRLYARLGFGRLTVLTYHQINDPANDYSTVSTAAFREQMEFLKQHYCVVSLEEAVNGVGSPRCARRLVAVTFDDGYRDNATIAAPILRSLGLTACFFVATEMVGSPRQFPHDVLQRKRRQEHMTWEQLRITGRGGVCNRVSHPYPRRFGHGVHRGS